MLCKTLICSMLVKDPCIDMIRDCIKHCHSIACAYLKGKIRNGKLNLNMFHLTLEDLATDCIADMFERGEDNSFRALQRYFSNFPVKDLPEEETKVHLRKLVFTYVNQRLFRLYRENDPSLARIIRYLRSQVESSECLELTARGEETWVSLIEETSASRNLPTIEQELLEIKLSERLSQSFALKDFLKGLVDVFLEEDSYAHRFPLVGLALIVRSRYCRLQDGPEDGAIDDKSILSDEIGTIINKCVESTKNRFYASYVQRSKVDQPSYEAMLKVVHKCLRAEFLSEEEPDQSLFSRLRNQLPEITRSEYLERHRIYLEYLARVTRKEILLALSDEYK